MEVQFAVESSPCIWSCYYDVGPLSCNDHVFI